MPIKSSDDMKFVLDTYPNNLNKKPKLSKSASYVGWSFSSPSSKKPTPERKLSAIEKEKMSLI